MEVIVTLVWLLMPIWISRLQAEHCLAQEAVATQMTKTQVHHMIRIPKKEIYGATKDCGKTIKRFMNKRKRIFRVKIRFLLLSILLCFVVKE